MTEAEASSHASGKPYVGACPIEPGQPFFGREAETADLISRLVARRIVLLYSPSGAGKTSLIQAGVIPALQAQGFLVLPTVRVSRQAQPGQIPAGLAYSPCLLSALLSLDEGLPAEQQTPLAELTQTHLLKYLDRQRAQFAQRSPRPAGQRTLLVFDQFEEVLTFGAAEPARKEIFFDELMAVLYDNRYWVLFAMREDYLPRLEPYLSFFPDRLSAHYPLEFLGPTAALEAVRTPAKQFGVDFKEDAARKLVDDLRQVRVQGASGEVAIELGPFIEPVQLQVVCSKLWDAPRPDPKSITLADVEKWGVVQNALADYYADKVKRIAKGAGQSERRMRDWFGEQLISPGGLRIQVQAGRESEYGLTLQSVGALINSWLVRDESRRGASWYELAHDRLIDPILKDNERWQIQELSDLQRQAEVWEREHRPDRLLLDEASLAQAETWAREHAGELNQTEREFLEKNRQVRQEQLEKNESDRRALQDKLQLENAARQAKRQRRYVVALSALLVVIGILALLAGYYYRKANIEARNTRHNLAISYGVASQRAGQDITRKALTADISQESTRKLLTALHALRVTNDLNEPVAGPARQAAYEALRLVGGRRLEAPADQTGAPSPLMKAALSPDGRWLAAAGEDFQTYVWDLQASPSMTTPLALNAADDTISGLAFSPDGRWLAAGSLDGSMRLWDTQAENPFDKPVQLFQLPARLNALAFSPDGRWLAAGSTVSADRPGDKSSLALLWDLQCDKIQPLLKLDLTQALPTPQAGDPGQDVADSIESLAFTPDSRWLTAGGVGDTRPDGSTALVVAWDVKDRPPCQADAPIPQVAALDPGSEDPASPETMINNLATGDFGPPSVFGPPGQDNVVITADTNYSLRMWPLGETGFSGPPVVLNLQQGTINDLAYNPQNGWLAVASGDGSIYLWSKDRLIQSVSSGTEFPPALQLSGHAGDVTGLAFSPDGERLISGGADQTLRLWDLTAGDPSADALVLWDHTDAVKAVTVSQEPPWLASASKDGSLRLYNLARANPAALPLTFHPAGALALRSAIHPGWVFQTRGGGDTGDFFDLQAQQAISQTVDAPALAMYGAGFSGPNRDLINFVFSPDGYVLAASGSIGPAEDPRPAIYYWTVDQDTKTLEAKTPLEIPETPTNLAFSDNAGWLLATGESGTMYLFDLYADTPAPLALQTGETQALSAAFSPDNRWLVLGGMDGVLYAWELDPARNGRDTNQPGQLEPTRTKMVDETAPICALAFRPLQGSGLVVGVGPERIYTWSPDEPGRDPHQLKAFTSFETAGQTQEQFDRMWKQTGGAAAGAPGDGTPPATPADGDPCNRRPVRLLFSPDGRWLAAALNQVDPQNPTRRIGLLLAADLTATDLGPLERFKRTAKDAWSKLGTGELHTDTWAIMDNIGAIQDLAFSPDNQWLAAASSDGDLQEDGMLRLWRLDDLASEPTRLADPTAPLDTVIFSPDNRWLVTRDDSGIVQLWAMDAQELIDLACRAIGRPVTKSDLEKHIPGENWSDQSGDFCP